jgi:hypothetical protein
MIISLLIYTPMHDSSKLFEASGLTPAFFVQRPVVLFFFCIYHYVYAMDSLRRTTNFHSIVLHSVDSCIAVGTNVRALV